MCSMEQKSHTHSRKSTSTRVRAVQSSSSQYSRPGTRIMFGQIVQLQLLYTALCVYVCVCGALYVNACFIYNSARVFTRTQTSTAIVQRIKVWVSGFFLSSPLIHSRGVQQTHRGATCTHCVCVLQVQCFGSKPHRIEECAARGNSE